MTRTRRWITGSAIAVLLSLGGLFLVVYTLLPSDEEFAADLSARFEKASGIGLRVGKAHWALRPVPVVVLNDLATRQDAPITVRQLVVRPQLASLWNRKIAVNALEIEGAVIPSASVRAFRGRLQPDDAARAMGGVWTLAALPLGRVSVRDIVWIDRRGISLAYDADVAFDEGWRPRQAEAWRPGASPAARLRLDRDGEQDRWRTTIDVGGGTWNGVAELKALDQGRLRLTAQLDPKGVDIAGMLRAFDRRSAIEGKIEGQTTIDAEGDGLADLAGRLHTRTRFALQPAMLSGFDLVRAVRTAGTSRGGQTQLQSLTGTLDTQSTDDGVLLRYTDLKARSGLLTASGSATVLNRKLDGEAAVDIVDGVVGMPLKLGGTLDAPLLSLTGGALAGAVAGSAVLPGVGTAIGARIGQKFDKIFGSDDPKRPARPAAAQPKPR